MSARCRAIEELYHMRRLAAFREHLKERLEYTRSAEPPEPLPYAVPFAKFFGQRSPGNAVDRKIVDCLQEFTVVTPRLSPARLHRVEHVKCDPPIPLRHSRQHVRLPDAGHAVIRLISDSGIRQKCMPGIPSTRPSQECHSLAAQPYGSLSGRRQPSLNECPLVAAGRSQADRRLP